MTPGYCFYSLYPSDILKEWREDLRYLLAQPAFSPFGDQYLRSGLHITLRGFLPTSQFTMSLNTASQSNFGFKKDMFYFASLTMPYLLSFQTRFLSFDLLESVWI